MPPDRNPGGIGRMAASKMSCRNPTSSDLPGRPNVTIRSPLSLGPGIKGLGHSTGTFADINALICRYVFALTGETAMPRPYGRGGAPRFRSLRLSVRTPPFHGGESGSIPLGSAIYFNGLAPIPPSISPPHAVSPVLRQSISARRNQRSGRIFFDCATGRSFSRARGT